jgi:hypothetical protein
MHLAPNARAASRSTVGVYNGRALLGFIHQNGDGKHDRATEWPRYRKLGALETRKEAADAISGAHESSGKAP